MTPSVFSAFCFYLLPGKQTTGQYLGSLKVLRLIRWFYSIFCSRSCACFAASAALSRTSASLLTSYVASLSLTILNFSRSSAEISTVASHLSIQLAGGLLSRTPFFDTQTLLSLNFSLQMVMPSPMTSPQLRLQLQLYTFQPFATTKPLELSETPMQPTSSSFSCTLVSESTCMKPISTSVASSRTSISKQVSAVCSCLKQTAAGVLPLYVTLKQGPWQSYVFFSMVKASGHNNTSRSIFLR